MTSALITVIVFAALFLGLRLLTRAQRDRLWWRLWLALWVLLALYHSARAATQPSGYGSSAAVAGVAALIAALSVWHMRRRERAGTRDSVHGNVPSSRSGAGTT